MSEQRVERLKLDQVVKRYKQGDRGLEVLKGASMTLYSGEIVALVGPSGSGKSTLLHIAGLLEKPDAGRIEIAGQETQDLADRERTAIRRRRIGFVYQYHHLLPEFTALENLIVPQMIAGLKKRKAAEHARELLNLVGLGERVEHRPARLSGGEQQRVALARAIINRPSLVLADEPTGNLDPETADSVFDLLQKLVRGTGVAAMIATHNLELARSMDRILLVEDGQLVGG
ncbi:ABC transporter ATP-binding protein [Fodinicurvata fenggangensis]|uniref:ABC transporter ATP-binding protein n=1 Tax=Fodinicurvata fenggangensis TaxID=1121830 RepID=UPI000479CE46|nr:ABC transporter ATP-binding protein [Fodinicurvata fenggangensis]